MIRIFTHYISAKTALLFVLEALILMFAVYAATSLSAALFGGTRGIPLQQLAVVPLVALILMTSMGLYQLDSWEEVRSVKIRMLLALVASTLFALLVLNASQTPQPDAIIATILLALFLSEASAAAMESCE